jgi:NAD-dependent dihydropyrimidine dehydrogenase PreA subunit
MRTKFTFSLVCHYINVPGLRKNMPVKVDIYECVGCGTCADECPQEAILMNDDDIAVISDECTDCGLCVDACPTAAISSDR